MKRLKGEYSMLLITSYSTTPGKNYCFFFFFFNKYWRSLQSLKVFNLGVEVKGQGWTSPKTKWFILLNQNRFHSPLKMRKHRFFFSLGPILWQTIRKSFLRQNRTRQSWCLARSCLKVANAQEGFFCRGVEVSVRKLVGGVGGVILVISK